MIQNQIYITQKYKKLDSKLKEKDKWIYYDEYGWGNLVPRNENEFNKEEFINEFTYSNKNNKISFFMKSFITITRNNVNLTFNKYNIFESKIIYLFKAVVGKNIYFLIIKQNKMIFFKIKT